MCGGDTDTIAAMSGACCGALVGESALPSPWVERLERGAKGVDHIRALADAVFDLWRCIVCNDAPSDAKPATAPHRMG
jgi:hypothetical protein